MIQLLSREEALNKNSTLASFIKHGQENQYAPELFEPGENWLEEKGGWVELSAEECKERNEPILAKYNRIKDDLELVSPLGELIDESILTTQQHGSAHFETMSKEFEQLIKVLKWEGVLFILEFPFRWMEILDPGRNADLEMKEWFFEQGADEEFNGAVYAKEDEVEKFSKLLMRVKTNNANFPICCFAGVRSRSIGSVCKYGNIHFLNYGKESSTDIVNGVNQTKLELIPFGACEYKF